ncbi:RNB domain-containing ribonuclease [Methanoregula sp. UBA64]|uniref:RNB domain-containing ribonuclease n=1 Tax=Methanoregula sp. UBA64 TaxID=1915554 RepID=UPI0025F3F0FF|nr:RNB domain-containing ribonuclease [Methanoregula sp. UBA64]
MKPPHSPSRRDPRQNSSPRHIHDVNLKTIAWHAMEKYGFVPRFPPAVMDQVGPIQEQKFYEVPAGTEDLRSLLWSSIDNHDSRDLDQLEYCERCADGGILVKVAIADVDSLVRRQTPADEYAGHNGTTIYTGVLTFPMLPEKLSYGITSLLPDRDRLSVVIEFIVRPDGSFVPQRIFPSLVCNRAKLVYEVIGAWFDGTAPVPEGVRSLEGLEAQLQLQNEAAGLLRTYRRAQGALELDTLEAEVVMENDEVRGLVTHKHNPARGLIEEFMVAANGTMVAQLGKAGLPMIQRVVKTPRDWAGMVLVAATVGETLPEVPDARALAQFLTKQKAADPLHFPDLSLTVVKLMGPGEYVLLEPGETPTGHFALAVVDYTHATAPNRRYVDIINQRMIKAVFHNQPCPYSPAELRDRALWLSDREKASKKVKRFMRKSVAAVLLADSIGKNFDALVTGAADKGTYVRLLDPPAEGRVTRGERGLFVGQKVRVRLLATDPYNGYIDFECIGREKMG